MLKQNEDGFTIIEITIAILILTAAVLGIAATTGQMIGPSGDAELEFIALQAAEDRLAQIRMDPRYTALDSLYAGTESTLPGLPNVSRKTSITRTQATQSGGGVWDYTTVVVVVSGGLLKTTISRKLLIGAP